MFRVTVIGAMLWAVSANAQAIDPSKPVTLTFGEITQLMEMAGAEAKAADAEFRAKTVMDKVRAQTNPSEATSKPGPVPPPMEAPVVTPSK